MKIITPEDVEGTEREVRCPSGGFTSFRYLLERDGMGFSVHLTVIPPFEERHWHYKNHLEACYCIKGEGWITDIASETSYRITPGTLYALDKHDDHTFQAVEEVHLISIFNPPVIGDEVHDADGSYAAPDPKLSLTYIRP